MQTRSQRYVKPTIQGYCEQTLVSDLVILAHEQSNTQKDIKALYGYYVTENRMLTHFNFVLQCVKVLIGMYPMSLVEAKAFVDNSLK